MADVCFLARQGTLYTIKAVMVLDADGNRLLSKYYSNEWAADKQAPFEKSIFSKAQSNFACTLHCLLEMSF